MPTRKTYNIQVIDPKPKDITVIGNIVDSPNKALQFDGVQNYLDLGTLGSLGANAGSGIYCKFDIKTTSTARGFLGEYNTSNISFYIEFNTNASEVATNKALMMVFEGANNTFFLGGANSPTINFNDGGVHTIEFTYVPPATLTIKIDGISQTVTVSRNDGGYTYGNFPINFYIGAQNSNSTAANFFNAVIDNFSIGNTASTIVASYNFNEGTGTTAADGTGTNTATLKGSPLPLWTSFVNNDQKPKDISIFGETVTFRDTRTIPLGMPMTLCGITYPTALSFTGNRL